MLPKTRRISKKEFPNLMKNSRRFNSPHFLLYLSKNNENKPQNNSRFSFSVSKKVCKEAVSRNKLRRRGYAVIEHIIERIKPGLLCFFVYKKDLGNESFSFLEKEINTLLLDSGVLT